jgi:transketolase
MGRSKLPTITSADGEPSFAEGYGFAPGEFTWARLGAGQATLLAMGTPVGAAVAASDELRFQGIEVAVGVVATPLELDEDAMRTAVRSSVIVTIEDHSVRSGLGASVADWLARHPVRSRLVTIGVDGYMSSGASADLFARAGLDSASIVARVRAELGIE